MNKVQLINRVKRTFHKGIFTVKKHSPEILVTTGIIGMAFGAVMACRATTKVNDILENTKGELDRIHEAMENPEAQYKDSDGEIKPYTEEVGKKDITITYAHAALDFTKLYGPAVAVGVLSAGCILTGVNILHERNLALAAAYTVVDNSFKEYRGRVIERFGEELDRELKYNIKAKEVEEVVTDENGEEKTVKKIVHEATFNPSCYSEYARIYDDGCKGWTKNPEYNLVFLNQQQAYANRVLQERGHVFLNEVYELLGFPKTQAGQQVGWVYDEKGAVGDNFIDFGIYDPNNAKARDFVNGYERNIVLDFNVDGPILHILP